MFSLCDTLEARVCSVLTLLFVEVGDLNFQAPRRAYGLTAAAQSYGYIFTDLRPDAYAPLGVNHSAELCNIFGSYLYSTVVHQNLSMAMLDYWLSFVVSLTPNDGKGSNSTFFVFFLLS